MMIFKNEGGERSLGHHLLLLKKKKKSDGSETISYLHCTSNEFHI